MENEIYADVKMNIDGSLRLLKMLRIEDLLILEFYDYTSHKTLQKIYKEYKP